MRTEVLMWGAASMAFWYLSCRPGSVSKALLERLVKSVVGRVGLNASDSLRFAEMVEEAVRKGEKNVS